MRISQAAEATGLTKKAIKFYEAEGLVSPAVDAQTGYRSYDDAQVLRLELIHTLRSLDVPIADIRKLLSTETPVAAMLQQALERATAQAERLEEARSVLAALLAGDVPGIAKLHEEVRRVRQAVQLSREERRLRLEDELQRVFPGSFGRVMALLYAPFLDVELETAQQKLAWPRFIAYLDELREPPADHPFLQLARIEDEAAVTALLEGEHDRVARLLEEDPAEVAALRDAMKQFLNSLKEDPTARQRYEDRLTASKDLWDAVDGSSDAAFDEHLAALNDDYRRYLEIGQRIREEAEREVGIELAAIQPPDPR